MMADRLIQYIVIRKDLVGKQWSMGAIVAQGCHAATAAIAKTLAKPETIQYLEDYEGMTKCVLGADNVDSLTNLASNLSTAGIDHHIWVEQPENIPVALATAPNFKSKVSSNFKEFKLLK
jgi:peptidyl-tRNA hydrolase